MKTLENYDRPPAPENLAPNEDKCEVLVIGHCLLNPLARIKGAKPPLPLDTKGANVIQLPCPEAMFFGMRRREITRDQLDHPAYRRFCRKLFTPFADLLEDLAASGIKIKIIGVPKSPSCGVEMTSVGGEPGKVKEFHHRHAPGPGVFMEEIIKELKKRGVEFEIEDAGK
jgi:predicted secreted protein